MQVYLYAQFRTTDIYNIGNVIMLVIATINQ